MKKGNILSKIFNLASNLRAKENKIFFSKIFFSLLIATYATTVIETYWAGLDIVVEIILAVSIFILTYIVLKFVPVENILSQLK